ncbi:laminin subunit alpha-5 [Austrofundulus limnaeus]|uniref:Laminin subunit alpha-5 n=2 Tax=Austrofundulus limnaeus TaxID=52670 RepID=A0A2I4D1E2_AUSLI|nr:PREDICTED: laminin subunit alpha-5-like [Austrofundulus limnaeus]
MLGFGPVVRLLWPLLVSCCRPSSAQELLANGLNGYSLHPPYFNLAEGTKITATATCGEDESGRSLQDLYCKLVGGPVSGDPSQTIQGQYCDICSKEDGDRAHPITNAIDGTERWWQSPPLSRSTEYNELNVTLDLGQLFHVAYVLIKFANSPRPDLWVLERSTDFGQTYQPWQYFASSKRDCIERFGQRTIERISSDDDVICTIEYSRIVPLENGEIVVSLVNGRPGAMNFSYSPVLREFTKATNIRLRFLRTNTLLGHLMGKALRDPTVTRRYYYSIKDISIGGRCVCNGHAEACDAKDPNDPYKLQCDCQHNTCGVSCDQCCPGYHQLPWKPATTYSANECESCNCHRHSFDCYYDPDVDRRRASVDLHGHRRGGGVCLNCQHHTMGINCERCLPTFYRSPDHPIDSPQACLPCNCQSEFTDGTCEDLTGRCFCKPNYAGENCDSCASGFINFPECYPIPTYPPNNNGEAKPAGEIINCECSAAGTVDNSCRPDPRTQTCICKPGFTGDHCDTCAPGFYGLNCQACQCSGPGCLDGSCDLITGSGICRSGFHGYQCDQCAPGYFNYPLCQLCGCSSLGSLPAGCDASGHCLCKAEFQGPRCEQCRSGFHSYPNCRECSCDLRTSLNTNCTTSGICHCRPNYSGASCDQCAPGYYGYPTCTACRCSSEGSRYRSCEQLTGQCVCLPGVGGLRCDSCAHGAYGFPRCQAGACHPAGSVQSAVLPSVGECECRRHVEGPACDKCKPLFWNLSPDSVDGCSDCECNTAGTLSAVAECEQERGQCHCKPNVCSGTCSTCKDGFYNLQDHDYFGCQGCRCDTGGSVGQFCGDRNGQCRCRPNVEGPQCNLPRPDHYFPDLHHLKFEIEEGSMLDGRPVRFGYNLLEFPDFSWRGYAQMSPIQSKVLVSVLVTSPDLFHVVLRYANWGGSAVRGRVAIVEDSWNYYFGNCSEQSKQILFTPSSQPTFINVPQNNYVEPFVLNPGTWTVVIEAEGILLDYLVLLPSAYYEAPILQMRVTDPCTYSSVSHSTQNCLLYRYLSLDSFPSISGNDASCRNDNHLPRPCPTEKVTPRHPTMAVCSGMDISVDLGGHVSSPGDHVLIVEYSSEEELPQTLSVVVNTPVARKNQHRVTLLHCTYSFLCRAVVMDEQNRVAVFTLPADTQVQLTSNRASFFLNKVYLVPKALFNMEYVEPKVHCISSHGLFSPDSSSCVPSRFQTPTDSLVLKEGQSSSTQEEIFHVSPAAGPPLSVHQGQEPVWIEGVRPPFGADSSSHMRLDSLQNAVVYSARVQSPGRYIFILHFHQPLHPTYPVQVYINGGRIWQGITNASFCPHAYGCRNVLVSENQIILDVTQHSLFLTVQIPADKTLWLDYVLVVPETSYSSSYLNEEPLDKSYDFISSCGQNSFYINPSTASPFCLSSAISLSAFFNNGALPCACHEVGAESDTCEQFGGQCKCRPNVIGRDCSMCATGFWGFPNCRPCNCGPRLCEPVTGDCICPPRTLRPECTQCEPQTFGCHPLVGCEVCNCSHPGVVSSDVSCDTFSGQCSCKNNVVGRRCDHCAPGFYGYPNCRPCDCNEAGTEEGVCDSFTGQCLCKENVQGSRCDQCRIGTFHLDPTNPKGCTSCFCFGATDRCHSSNKRRTEIMDMEGWVLLGADRQEVPVTVYPDQDLVEADLSDVPDVYQDLHWHAPNKYLGDKVSSYGGYLRYRLHTQAMRGDALPLPAEASRPDIILKGNQMTLVFMEREYSSPEEPHLGIVHIVEGSFRHAQTGNSVSREELMMVLVDLESLQVRALHSQSAHSVSLRGAVLEGAENLPTGRHANNVEICTCPANYHGDSCQTCAPGFYRDTIGLFLGKCVPCSCNGHSDQCLDGSGICVNCLHDTIGNHCEGCKGGFHSNNSLDGQAVSCSSCPCPLRAPSNNFAEGCVQRGDRMQCLCMHGYAGPNCERCAPGFYGNPMVVGSRCQPCRCNDNTDPNMLFTDCHPLTGECLSCMHNTAGLHCHVCAPGYYGDAIGAKNCTKCNCSSCGTESCDPHTGQCHCKPGVTGPRCEQCQVGMFGFSSCSGCRQCECDASAALVQPCESQSGQCACQPGVTGPTCRQCAPGYWDYGPDGCKKCDCRGGHCDPRTGDCRCPDGMTGKQCDICTQQHTVPVETKHGVHCETCDSCVMVLLQDLEEINMEFSSVGSLLTNLNASSMSWAQLFRLNGSIEDVSQNIRDYNSSLDDSRSRADMLEADIINISDDIDELQKKVEAMTHKTGDLDDRTIDTHQRADHLLSFINNISMDINAMLLLANQSLNETETGQDDDERERKMREVQAIMREMRLRNLTGQKNLADREKMEADKLLDRVQKELADRQQENKNLTKEIRDRLARFHSDLMDLREFLNEAVNNTAAAAELNNVNEKTLEDNQRRSEELLLEQKEVKDLLSMAEDDVTLVNEVLSSLQDSKEEYERLAANLDGARTPLAKKVQSFASTDSLIPLVEDAERHANMLSRFTMNLSSLILETRKEGTVNVTKAYSNIIDIINAAEEAANMADRAANDTLENIKNHDLGQMADKLKNRSMELNDEAKQLSDNLNSTLKPRLEDAQRRLDEAKTKHVQTVKDLEAAQNMLNLTSNVTQDINEVKQVTGAANSTVTEVIDQLRPIRKQLDDWQKLYGDTNTTNDDISNALMDANNTVTKLSETIPTLMKKLDELQNHSIQMPNISENINRIRQLIQQARNAASKVRVSMKFNGVSGVQVRTPSNLADLAAYNSMRFYITLTDAARQRRQNVPDPSLPKQFVFYLGNKDSNKEFLGMAREGQRLVWHYNVGGQTAQVMMNKDVMTDGNFNEVFLQRIRQYGQMSMSSVVSDLTETTLANVEAQGDQGLLNLQSSDTVFYVGGYPKTFIPPPPLNFSYFKGGIELDTLNEAVISLYNFEQTFEMNTTEEKPYGRSKSTQSPGWENEAAYFDGSGFAEVVTTERTKTRFDLELKLLSYKGIIFFLYNENKFLCLAVLQGRLKVFYNFNGSLVDAKPEDSTSDFLKISDGEARSLNVFIVSSKQQIVVRQPSKTLFTIGVDSPGSLQFQDTYYLGGVPQHKMPESLKMVFSKQSSVKACFRNMKANNNFINLKTMNSTGVSFGCESDLLVAREAYFDGQSLLDAGVANVSNLRSSFYISFSFRTEKNEGLMFNHISQGDTCQVFLRQGHIVVRTGSNEIRTQKTYNDNNSHNVAVYNNINGMRLYMDDVLEKVNGGGRRMGRAAENAGSEDTTYVGGVPNSNLANFTGCIRNIFIKRDTSTQMVLNLMKVKENVNVPLSCPAAKKPQLIVAMQPKRSNKPKGKNKKPSGSRSRNTRESCQGPVPVPESRATHFSGSAHSYQRYDSVPGSLSSVLHLSLELKISSSSGCVLHAAGRQRGRAAVALSVSDGFLLLSVDAGRTKVSLRSNKKYQDERWHTVFIRHEDSRISLIIDGISAQSKRIPSGTKTRISGPLYIGGVPAVKTSQGCDAFIGCVRDLTLNRVPAGVPAHSQGTVPCFPSPLQPGAYFSGRGGHLETDQVLVLSQDVEVQLEVRPISDSGLLLHAGSSADQHLSLVLSQGEVTVAVNSGKGEFRTSFRPERPLCNGLWHTITVVKKNNRLQLRVDGDSRQSVGPTQNRSMGTKVTLYLGGKPSAVKSASLPDGSFQGCIRNMSVNHRRVELSEAVSVHGAVGLRGCPHM